jgi:hypothetical protein
MADGVHISPGAHFAGGVWVGEGTWVGIGSAMQGMRIWAWAQAHIVEISSFDRHPAVHGVRRHQV